MESVIKLRQELGTSYSKGKVSIEDYISLYNGHSLFNLTLSNGKFTYINNQADASDLARIYSRAKYGSMSDIKLLAKYLIDYFYNALDNIESYWYKLFSQAKENNEIIVFFTTGWRNVPSTANVLYGIVINFVNIKLAELGFPTIVNVKLPRIAPPCENYASLSFEERLKINQIQDHIIPDRNFYEFSDVHVIFGDDILITGNTADKVYYESMRNGAKSFQSIYPIVIDPTFALTDAQIEERFNHSLISDKLNEDLIDILNNKEFTPILRTLRTFLSEENEVSFKASLIKINDSNLVKIYFSALNNDFMKEKIPSRNLNIIRNNLLEKNALQLDKNIMEYKE
ncbi:TPA: hypothetical protein QB288_000179 [Pasteurella multocida]|nr:hypothetical protein [Pasteurella multocida]